MQDPMEENNGGDVDSLARRGVVAFCRGEKEIISVGFEFSFSGSPPFSVSEFCIPALLGMI